MMLFLLFVMLLVDHAAFDVAILAVLRADAEFLTALWGRRSHIKNK